MKNKISKVWMCIVMLIISANISQAQEMMTVSGKVLNFPKGALKPRPFLSGEDVFIFAFNTVKAAKDAKAILESGSDEFIPDAQKIAGPDGYYEIPVAENGALVIHVAMKNILVEINHQENINITFDGVIDYEEVLVIVHTKPRTDWTPHRIIGTQLIF